MKPNRMNYKVCVQELKDCGIIVIGYSKDEKINVNDLSDRDRLIYFKSQEKEMYADDE